MSPRSLPTAAQARSVWHRIQRRVGRSFTLLAHDEWYTNTKYARLDGAQIGDGGRLSVKSLGSEPYLISIGHRTSIAADVVFITHDGATWAFRDQYPGINAFGRIVIGSHCFVGARAVLLPGISIGDRSVVAAGSVVVTSIPPGVVAAGVPARVISTVEEYRRKCQAASLPLAEHAGRTRREILEDLVPQPSLATEAGKSDSHGRQDDAT